MKVISNDLLLKLITNPKRLLQKPFREKNKKTKVKCFLYLTKTRRTNDKRKMSTIEKFQKCKNSSQHNRVLTLSQMENLCGSSKLARVRLLFHGIGIKTRCIVSIALLTDRLADWRTHRYCCSTFTRNLKYRSFGVCVSAAGYTN